MIPVGSFQITPRMRDLIVEVLDSGRISYGEKSRAFEQQFAILHNCNYGILSNSGTSSLHVAIQTLKEVYHWPNNSEILIPATTFVATANTVIHNGLMPVPVDVRLDTFGIDPDEIHKHITQRTCAIIPVHMLGQPCDMTQVMAVAYKYNLRIIEDSCEAMFVKHRGRIVGSMGDIGCFSTYVAHLLVTGVGGIAVTNNPEYASRMRSLVNHGLSIENLNTDENFAPRPMLNRKFSFDRIGHSFRITEFEAALGLAGLEVSAEMHAARQRNATYLLDRLTGLNRKYDGSLTLPQVLEGNEHSWMMFGLATNYEPKDRLVQYLNQYNIETRDIPSLLYQKCYHWDANDYPISKVIATNAFYIGCHPSLTIANLDYMADTIGNYLEQS